MSDLVFAIEQEEWEYASFLITEKTANEFKEGTIPVLWLAIRTAPVYIIQKLIEHGADVNRCSFYHGGVMTVIANANRVDLVPLFIQKGADVNFSCDVGLTPLMEAQTRAMVSELIRHGANRQAKTIFGRTAYDKAPSHLQIVLDQIHIMELVALARIRGTCTLHRDLLHRIFLTLYG
jgi:ankyrin repeat protein